MPTVEWISVAAQVVVALVALAALIIAGRQLAEAREQRRESRRLRREEAQPHVVVFMEPSLADEVHIDLVIANLGATSARDVRVAIDPPPGRSERTGIEDRLSLPEVIPVLVPDQRWRIYWDSVHHRRDSDLPARHVAKVEFGDSFGERHTYEWALDWDAQRRGHLVIYNVHHAAKALREIAREMASWREPARGGLRVWSRDGEARAERAKRGAEE